MTGMLNEAWEAVMYNYMRSVGSNASLYWVAMILVSLIIMKLFLAIFLNYYL